MTDPLDSAGLERLANALGIGPPRGPYGVIPEYDGRHLWVVPAYYRIIDPEEWRNAGTRFYFVHENLMAVHYLQCYRCQVQWNVGLDDDDCPGGPR